MYSRAVTSIDMSQQVSQIVVNSTTFNFSRTSHQGSLPLISTLLIIPVTHGLNRTKVNCTEVGNVLNSGPMTSATTINIRDSYSGKFQIY